MEMRRLAARDSRLGQTVGSLTAWYGLAGGYGERWGRPIAWFLALWLVCAVLYLQLGLLLKVPEPSAPGQAGVVSLEPLLLPAPPLSLEAVGSASQAFGHALLHSLLVASLLGRDAYALPASPWSHVILLVEAILGPLFLGLTALAIQRQFKR